MARKQQPDFLEPRVTFPNETSAVLSKLREKYPSISVGVTKNYDGKLVAHVLGFSTRETVSLSDLKNLEPILEQAIKKVQSKDKPVRLEYTTEKSLEPEKVETVAKEPEKVTGRKANG